MSAGIGFVEGDSIFPAVLPNGTDPLVVAVPATLPGRTAVSQAITVIAVQPGAPGAVLSYVSREDRG
jgi:hypothetical protein